LKLHHWLLAASLIVTGACSNEKKKGAEAPASTASEPEQAAPAEKEEAPAAEAPEPPSEADVPAAASAESDEEEAPAEEMAGDKGAVPASVPGGEESKSQGHRGKTKSSPRKKGGSDSFEGGEEEEDLGIDL